MRSKAERGCLQQGLRSSIQRRHADGGGAVEEHDIAGGRGLGAASGGVTAAVKTTVWPKADGLVEEMSAVAVALLEVA